jgi:hypothetical protein
MLGCALQPLVRLVWYQVFTTLLIIIIIIIIIWRYSPTWALASCAIRLHWSLSWAFLLHDVVDKYYILLGYDALLIGNLLGFTGAYRLHLQSTPKRLFWSTLKMKEVNSSETAWINYQYVRLYILIFIYTNRRWRNYSSWGKLLMFGGFDFLKYFNIWDKRLALIISVDKTWKRLCTRTSTLLA